MSTFGIRPGSFQEIRGKLLLRSVITYSIMLAGFAYITSNNANRVATALAGGSFVLLAIFMWFRNLKRQALLFESMQLLIDHDQITRTQHDTPTKTLAAAEITRIERASTGSFVIKGSRAADTIWMPAQVEFPEQLAQELSRFGPVLAQPAQAWYVPYASFLSLLILPLGYFFVVSPSKIITALTGIILIGGLAWSLWLIRRSKDIDNRVKRYSLVVLLPLVSLIGILIMKLLL